jgi:hypothetical protein
MPHNDGVQRTELNVCDYDIQVCEQGIRIQVIGIWRVSCPHGIYVFESVSWKVGWKVSCVLGIYMFESVSWKQMLHPFWWAVVQNVLHLRMMEPLCSCESFYIFIFYFYLTTFPPQFRGIQLVFTVSLLQLPYGLRRDEG